VNSRSPSGRRHDVEDLHCSYVGGVTAWQEIGATIYVRRHEHYDVNVGLVVGDGACLVIDTRESLTAGRELAAAVRTVTSAPWTVVNTHSHFDHFLGNAAFVPAEIWALDRCRDGIAESGEYQLHVYGDGDATPLVAPTHTYLAPSRELDIGGRTITLRHLGRGHTDNDTVIAVDRVVFAGDLVEEGAPPAFEDAYPLDWPDTIDALLRIAGGPVVPGHGHVVDREFVTDQRTLLEAVRLVGRSGAGPDEWARTGLPERAGRVALERVRRQLGGQLSSRRD
jgi:glyoxylase-like metal-dependent hydrolase (beta-lactamase superfamily II)